MVFVDKKQKLIKSFYGALREGVPRIHEIIGDHSTPLIHYKTDGSPVTQLDLDLSQYFEDLAENFVPDFTFYSEENYSDWSFPLLALDPLDGTREYIGGNDEWSISVGIFLNSSFEGQGWVYNPARRELFETSNPVTFVKKKKYVGEVSRSEWVAGFFTYGESSKFVIRPVGSIAYKLGRLSKNQSDFVVSLRPKSIWDIAGGTLLCRAAGLKFFSQGKEVTSVEPLYQPPLIWCHEELFYDLSKIFS